MQDDIIDRVIKEADYIIDNNATVRSTSKIFHVGKSTVHKDVSKRLRYIDKERYKLVRKILDKNLSERHLRGGEATKKKYQKIKFD